MNITRIKYKKNISNNKKEIPALSYYNFEGILDSFIQYINDDAKNCKGVHRGDLYQHSIWTMFWMKSIISQGPEKWFSWTCNYYGPNIPGYINGLMAAAIYHDIGKGGNISKIGKRDKYNEHPRMGFEMILGTRKYYKYINIGEYKGQVYSAINFDKLLDTNGVTSPLIKMYVAVSIGMHYNFGLDLVNTYINLYPNSLYQPSNDVERLRPMLVKYLNNISDYVKEYIKIKPIYINVWDCNIFIPLIEFCIVVSTSDVLGAQYYNRGLINETIRGIVIPHTKYVYCGNFKTYFEYNNWGIIGEYIKNLLIDIYIRNICPQKEVDDIMELG